MSFLMFFSVLMLIIAFVIMTLVANIICLEYSYYRTAEINKNALANFLDFDDDDEDSENEESPVVHLVPPTN